MKISNIIKKNFIIKNNMIPGYLFNINNDDDDDDVGFIGNGDSLP